MIGGDQGALVEDAVNHAGGMAQQFMHRDLMACGSGGVRPGPDGHIGEIGNVA